MIRNFKRSAAVIGAVAASSLALVACSDSSEDSADGGSAVELPGGYTLSGATGGLVAEGASSQQNAMDYFGAMYQEATGGDAYLEYNPTGSGSGRTNFVAGQVVFAGSDSPLEEDQVDAAAERCGGNEAWHLPFVIGPVAVAYNLEGVEEPINLTTETLAKIFAGDITKWNDEAIASENEGVELPDTDISVVYRSDESGTSDNFQKFLNASTGEWEGEGTNFPTDVGEGANGSSGVATQVQQIDGGITYVEHSHAADSGLGIANIDFGQGPTELNEETVGQALENMEFTTEGNNMVVDSDALFASDAGYPLILTTYEIVCSGGYSEEEANLVKDFLMTALAYQDEGLSESGHIPVTGGHYDRLVEAVQAING
ncbi:phosphate ABC transporter substrate-binding protein PstS [Corynebacterium ammoniagenes]|uniref:phosphate ABC transporter substrate-binding protein PstS n=1 Tax=Corynebacterium ammoniagenes TaxID=1697 RepID=UPI001459D2FD|nr:phosphate ABC transporter substrate-binding protein PstS [Corynebacterium ammoniagenes]